MGTRADFYIKENDQIQWIGSKAMDGYAVAEADDKYISPNDIEKRTVSFLVHAIKFSKTKEDFVSFVTEYLTNARDGSFPKDGWPWPWDNSKLTDETYLFDDGRVWRMYKHDGEYEDNTTPCYFSPVESVIYDSEKDEQVVPSESISLLMPDMKDIANVTYRERSGLIVVTGLR